MIKKLWNFILSLCRKSPPISVGDKQDGVTQVPTILGAILDPQLKRSAQERIDLKKSLNINPALAQSILISDMYVLISNWTDAQVENVKQRLLYENDPNKLEKLQIYARALKSLHIHLLEQSAKNSESQSNNASERHGLERNLIDNIPNLDDIQIGKE